MTVIKCAACCDGLEKIALGSGLVDSGGEWSHARLIWCGPEGLPQRAGRGSTTSLAGRRFIAGGLCALWGKRARFGLASSADSHPPVAGPSLLGRVPGFCQKDVEVLLSKACSSPLGSLLSHPFGWSSWAGFRSLGGHLGSRPAYPGTHPGFEPVRPGRHLGYRPLYPAGEGLTDRLT